jgi:U32 family peptidase
MRIISPVDHLEEAEQLLDAGADELYGGIATSVWSSGCSRPISINQRTFDTARIDGLEELKAIVALVLNRNKAFSLTLNAPFYTDVQIELLTELVDEAVAVGISNVILADLGLMRQLRRAFPGLGLHLSSMAHLTNSLAAREYAAQGCQRLALERQLNVKEISCIIEKCPGMEFEVFMLVGCGPNTAELSSSHHSSADEIWPCELPYDVTPVEDSVTDRLAEAIDRQVSLVRSDRRHACGLCAIPHLQNSGVKGLKLFGRGTSTAEKLANIQLVREYVALAAEKLDPADFSARARQSQLARFGHPCSPNTCCYPEYYVGE